MKMTITLDGVPDDFAPLLASLLKAAGLHSEDVAAAIGLPPSSLSARVRGRTPWTLPEAAGACKALGADLEDFAHFYGKEAAL